MTNQFSSNTLVRWTAAFLAISSLFFASAVLAERSGESREGPASSEQSEAGEASESSGAGESQEGNAQAEGSHAEATQPDAGEGGKKGETLFGLNLENPWIVWGFVGVSLLLAVAVLRFGKPALLLTILLAGAAALLDGREVFFQFGRGNMLIVVLALITAVTHAAAAVLAFMALRAPGVVATRTK